MKAALQNQNSWDGALRRSVVAQASCLCVSMGFAENFQKPTGKMPVPLGASRY